MSRYDHKIETSLEGIEHLSKEKPRFFIVKPWKEKHHGSENSIVNKRNVTA